MGPSSCPEGSWYFEAERVPALPKHNCSFVPPLILDKDSEVRGPNWLHRDEDVSPKRRTVVPHGPGVVRERDETMSHEKKQGHPHTPNRVFRSKSF